VLIELCEDALTSDIILYELNTLLVLPQTNGQVVISDLSGTTASPVEHYISIALQHYVWERVHSDIGVE
jgi:hypothetical protein